MDFSVRSVLGSAIVLLIWFAPDCGWASLAVTQPTTLASNANTPEQQLSACVELAKSGNVQGAFDRAKRLHTSYRSQRMFDVSYVNTLLTIVDEVESPIERKIINEVIQLANLARTTKQYDGIQDPEIAFHFMNALSRLADITLEINERVSSKVRLFEGSIAINLSKNPNYPKNAIEALSKPLYEMAQGYAIRGESKKMVGALSLAVDSGFGDFEQIRDDEYFARVQDKQAAKKLIAKLESRYQVSVKKWAKQVLADFQSVPFYFDLPSTDGQRLNKSDFMGKVVVVDLWATWCPPCRKGIPHYIHLQEKWASRGVAVLGVSMDNPKDPMSALGTVLKFSKEQGFNYPCVLGDLAFSQQIPGKAILPTTVFLDASGKVRYIARGYHDLAKVEAITSILANESQPVRTDIPSLSR